MSVLQCVAQPLRGMRACRRARPDPGATERRCSCLPLAVSSLPTVSAWRRSKQQLMFYTWAESRPHSSLAERACLGHANGHKVMTRPRDALQGGSMHPLPAGAGAQQQHSSCHAGDAQSVSFMLLLPGASITAGAALLQHTVCHAANQCCLHTAQGHSWCRRPACATLATLVAAVGRRSPPFS